MKNICIVGCGNIGRKHAKTLRPHANLYFYSKSRQSAESLNRKVQGSGVFETYEAALENPKIEVIAICSPPEYHANQAIQALSYHKSILIEKPLCMSKKEMQDIESQYRKSQAPFFMVAENYCYKPALKKIKELIKNSDVGEVQSLFIQKKLIEPLSGWKKNTGAMLESGIHFIAFISDILQTSPQTVSAIFPSATPLEPERNCVLRLQYPPSIQATLEYSWNTPSLTQGVFQHSWIQGTHGRITFESNGLYIFLNSKHKKRIYVPNLSDITGHQAMSQDFVTSLYNPAHHPYYHFDLAKRDMNIVWAAYDQLPITPTQM